MTEDQILHIIGRLLENADEAVAESRKDRNDLLASGRVVAYYEMLDILQSELDAAGQDLEKFGLNLNLVRDYTG